jgi:hypothetical protein
MPGLFLVLDFWQGTAEKRICANAESNKLGLYKGEPWARFHDSLDRRSDAAAIQDVGNFQTLVTW